MKVLGLVNTLRILKLYVSGSCNIRINNSRISIRSREDFRRIRKLILHGFNIKPLENGMIEIKDRDGFRYVVNVEDIAAVTMIMFDKLYTCYDFLDYKGKFVLDVGAYIGDTSIHFVKRGARKIVAVEPIPKFFSYLVNNVKINNLEDRIIPLNVGLWFENCDLCINLNYGCSGSEPGNVCIRCVDFESLLEITREYVDHIDIAKIDCEGCEYSLLTTPPDALRRIPEYVIEIHGSPLPIIHKFGKAGFQYKIVGSEEMNRLYIVIFQQRS